MSRVILRRSDRRGDVLLIPALNVSLWAEYDLQPTALLVRSAMGAGTCGSGA